MDNLFIRGGSLISPERGVIETGGVLIQDGCIARIGKDEGRPEVMKTIDATGLYVAPGFIDLQVNGGGGHNFGDASPAGIHEAIAFHVSHGTTRLLPTMVTASVETIRTAIREVKQANHPAVLGVHIEGPFISAQRKGAHNAHHIIAPSIEEFDKLIAGHEGFIKIVTLAPELPGADRLITRIREIEAIPSLGHSNASYDETIAALEQGIALFTHLFNAMRGFNHREPGVVGAALDSAAMVELICDGIHIHPAIIRMVVKSKGIDEICLITDSISAAGLTDGEYSLGGLTVFVQAGQARLADGTLAGSTLTMNQAVRNFIEFTGCSLPEAVKTASLNPARLLGMQERKGSLEAGKDADIVIFDKEFNIRYTIIGGEIVYPQAAQGLA